jgi:hypothetical protein
MTFTILEICNSGIVSLGFWALSIIQYSEQSTMFQILTIFDAIISLGNIPSDSLIQFLTNPWNEVVWKIRKCLLVWCLSAMWRAYLRISNASGSIIFGQSSEQNTVLGTSENHTRRIFNNLHIASTASLVSVAEAVFVKQASSLENVSTI